MARHRIGANDAIRIAYLVSEYPGISHTFILREVRRLRALNFDIRVASINAPDRLRRHGREERLSSPHFLC